MKGMKKFALGLTVAAIGVTLGITALRAQDRAQDNDDSDPQMNILVRGSGESWLGVDLADVTAAQARDWKLGEDYGAVVNKVKPDSPAAKAGLETGDVIEQFGGQKVHSVAELRRMVNETPSGRTVQIEVRRHGDKKTLSATLEPRNGGMGPLMSGLRNNVWPDVNLPVYDFALNFGGARLGVEVEPLTSQLGAYFGVTEGKGVLVREVKEGSAAEKAGLKAGDCIVKLDSTSVESADDLHRALLGREREKKQDVTLTIVRDRKEQTLAVHLEAQPRPDLRSFTDSASKAIPNSEELEADASQLLDSQELAKQAQALRQQLESQSGDVRKEAEAARAQAKQLRDVLQKQKGEWMKQTGPAMEELQRELKQLRDSVDYGTV
ncbi:MAG TPA: PDZ domain-containing protein [Terriglobia bacterium]|jgi:membrane-associated protease RseP (regulator of RpoE activity)|nr:PDZ domain-containing protein [Terriglobia bacterium]